MSIFGPVTNDLVDVVLPFESGYSLDLQRGDSREALVDACGDAVRDFPQSLWIEPKDRAERARQNDENKTWALNYCDRFTNQGSGTNPIDGSSGYSTHECTCHSLSRNFEMVWNRQRAICLGGPETRRLPISAQANAVWVSPLSVYAEANPNQWGGANVQQVLEIAFRRGMLPEPVQPKPYKFKHILHGTCGGGNVNQSRGSWVPLSQFPEGWPDTAKHLRPLEVCFPRSRAEAECLLLNGYPLSVGRSGHAVPLGGIIWDKKLYPYADSYNVIRYDSSIAWQGSFAILSTTTPDDWDKPGG